MHKDENIFAYDKSARLEFAAAKRVEADFARKLVIIARHCFHIVRAFDPTDPVQLAFLRHSLDNYASAIRPWAGAVASRMVAEVAARDARAWIRMSQRMGVRMKEQLLEAPLDAAMAQLTQTQVALITSIPPEAADKVAEWTQIGISSGQRPKEISARIMSEIGGVTKARAMLIARTESSRAASTVTQARAEWVGCTHFRWMSTGDADVRPLHRKLDGRIFAYADPPVVDERTGIRGLPGQIWNCRCVQSPIIG